MIIIEASDTLRLRPSHLLMMMYRYASGVYQAGDISALNYTKGFLDGTADSPDVRRVLTVSGHGIGEAESWLASHLGECSIETVSFRLVDTQLMQFLRAAAPEHVEAVLSKFRDIVAPYPALAKLASDPGLVPYWKEQSKALKRLTEDQRIAIYGDHPEKIPASKTYDLIYASHGEPFLSRRSTMTLREHLNPGGTLAVLVPARDARLRSNGRTVQRFASSPVVRNAKRYFDSYLEQRGYVVAPQASASLDLTDIARATEFITFNVLAPADSVLIGELILGSLYDHVPDQARLEALGATASHFMGLEAPVYETLNLFLLGAPEGGT